MQFCAPCADLGWPSAWSPASHGSRSACSDVRAGVTPGHLDAFLPRGTSLPLREGPPRRRGGARPRALRGVSRPLSHHAHAKHAGNATVEPPAAAEHGAGRPRGLLIGPAAQAPRDRHPGEHRPGALVFESAARHPLIAVSGVRGDGVSGAGAGARLDDRHVGRRPAVPIAAAAPESRQRWARVADEGFTKAASM
jgi:hypothetical protein